MKPIPQLAAWEAHMTGCAKIIAAQPSTIDHSACTRPGCKVLNEGLAWYYDGNRVFRQIARYTKDPSWLEAAKKCRLYYRSYLNCPTVGHYVDGWPEVWGGKQFSQNYRWSFDYVTWRQKAPVR